MCDKTQHVVVRLLDINGPRGGRDKQCKIIIYSNGLAPIIISDTQESIGLAAEKALDRASLNLQRKLKRRQSIMQKMPRKLEQIDSTAQELG